MLVLMALCISFGPQFVGGVRLPKCYSNRLQVDERDDTVITCDQIGAQDTVEWFVRKEGATGDQNLGTCHSSGNCNEGLFALNRRSTQSTVTIKPSGFIRNLTNIRCGKLGDTTARAQCALDVVYPAVMPETSCKVEANTENTPWRIEGSCDITQTYSSMGYYQCQVYRGTNHSSHPIVMKNETYGTSLHSNNSYRTGSCTFSEPISSLLTQAMTEQDFYFRFVVYPGATQVAKGPVTIGRPSTALSHNCPQYVRESQDTSCTCTATDLGQPAGVVRWTSTMTNQLSLNVNNNYNGTTYTCEVIWNGQRTQFVNYTLQVAYGPRSVSITRPSFPYDTNGQQQLNLTCSAWGVNPAPTLIWVKGTANKVVGQGHTYTFRPQPPGDENSVFVCRAVNRITGTSRQDSTTLTLNYPPTQNPVITSTPSNSGGHLYQGDRVTLTCAVTGGKPFGATTVTFTCPRKRDSSDIEGSSGITSTVTFYNLTAADHNKMCTCTTRWKNTNWYNKTKKVKLFVNSPPSTPAITKPNNDYPPIFTVTQSASLTCHSTTPGVPISTYTWPTTRGGRQGTDGQGRSTLTFDTISKELDGKTVSCRARNRFTDNRPTHTVPDGKFTLEVYYKPEISTKPVADTDPNQCEITSSDASLCLVTEGQRVHIQCSASSNPQPAVIMWQSTAYGHHRRSSPDLLIETAHRADTGIYNCSVTTGRGNDGNDGRLPLKGFRLFTVLVKYPPSISFEVNSSPSSTLTVNASHVLNLSCRAVGRPPPETKLIHPSKSPGLIARILQGSPSVADTTSVVSGKLTARCRDTGIYTCTADNTVGSAQQQSISVFVQCKPEARNDVGDGSIPHVNYHTEPVQLNFSVTAYPLPELKRVKFFNQKPDETAVGQAAEEGTVAVECFSDGTVSAEVTCQVTIENVLQSSAGFYQAFIGNDFGDMKLEFEVQVNATYVEPVFSAGIVVGAIAAALVLSVIIAAVVFVTRRRKGKKQKPTSPSARRKGNREEPEMIINSIYGTSGAGNDGEDVMITNSLYESSETAAPRRNQPSTSQHGACAGQVASTGDVYAVVNKKKVPQSAPQDSSPVYAVVNKKKNALPKLPTATPGAMNEKPKVGKKPDTPKTAQKGKGKKHDKKGAVYVNVKSLSMAPPETEEPVYGNVGLQKHNRAEKDHKQKPEPEPEASRTVNPDGLVYTTVAFTRKQREKEKSPPPQREETEYVDIDFTRTKQKPEPEPEGSRTVNPDGLVYTTVAFTRKQREKEKSPPPQPEETEYVDIDFTRTVSN